MMLVPSLMKLPTQLVGLNVARQAPSWRPLLPPNLSSRPVTTPLSPFSRTAVMNSSFHELLGFVGPQDNARKADADQPFWEVMGVVPNASFMKGLWTNPLCSRQDSAIAAHRILLVKRSWKALTRSERAL